MQLHASISNARNKNAINDAPNMMDCSIKEAVLETQPNQPAYHETNNATCFYRSHGCTRMLFPMKPFLYC